MRYSNLRVISHAAVLATLAFFGGCGGSGDAITNSDGTPVASKIGHVFVIVLENEDFSDSFAANSAAPYLAQTLSAQGALLQNYYGIGHNSLDNYIAMLSGQGPNRTTQADCQNFVEFSGGAPTAQNGQSKGSGCVYPSTVPSLPDQLTTAKLSWKAYMEDMGNTPTRETASCGHPTIGSKDGTQVATADDQYATRHNPFVYFHAVIDDQASCDARVVNLSKLDADLGDAGSTANFIFITPNLCHDGHDSPCANGEAGGLASINDFLKVWVPKILAAPAFKQDGLLIISFDESNGILSDSSACCGEGPSTNVLFPGIAGPGGGKVGAVLLSPFIKAGTISTTDYNHYSMLRSVEDLFGLPYLGYAGLDGQASFGADVFTNKQPELPPKP
ncbi:MAG: phosphoesterase [Nevskia sp.]|nr:phosphoesterase [Nevskia sp.]